MTEEEYKREAGTLRPQLSSVALRYMHNKEDAEDMVQNVLIKLWNMRSELHTPMGPLAKVLTRNLCIDCLRHHPGLAQLNDSYHQGILEKAIDTNTTQAKNEMIDRMMQSIAHLPPKQQLILRLRHMDGMNMKEIAQLTGDSEASIRQTLCRARQGVRKFYTQDCNRD